MRSLCYPPLAKSITKERYWYGKADPINGTLRHPAGRVSWAESEGAQVKERSKEVYKKKEDGTQVESTSKKKSEVRDDDSGAASSTETKTESTTVKCAEGEELNKETGKCE